MSCCPSSDTSLLVTTNILPRVTKLSNTIRLPMILITSRPSSSLHERMYPDKANM